jgi:ATP-dependent helicase HrpA
MPSAASNPDDSSKTIARLRDRLSGCARAERRSIGRWLKRIETIRRSGRPVDRSLQKVERALEKAEKMRRLRAEAADRSYVYPEELPVSSRRNEISEAIRDNQVIVLCGETGSGKTTQLPKICLELGRGVEGLIGHTQPRRVAAQGVAERIADEVGCEIGGMVGWQVRFHRKDSDHTCVKMMTDGILLAETQDDPRLDRYDTIIIDEAHERSLNIDFLIGYLKRLLPKRPDLKVVITSATIDAERFSDHFDGCPVLEVSGRTYPVDVLNHDPQSLGHDGSSADSPEVVCSAVDLLLSDSNDKGDILIFVPGVREIRDGIDSLVGALGERFEILGLHARLPEREQRKIFNPGRKRRIILSTNVAETSLTVPGVTSVVDTGRVRISRFSARSRLQRLPVEQVSQASAGQRAGRCGRIAPGRCLRLYTEEMFESADAYTQPEILRSNLADVILRMLSLGLGAITDFPFLDKPSSRMVEEGWATLYELGAVDRSRDLTETGRKLARLSVDSRLGRMLIASIEERVLPEVLVIASALSTQDPRLRPAGMESIADFAHRAWLDQKSDFVGLLRLWASYEEARKAMGSSALRRWCHDRHLSVSRIREWVDVHSQLRQEVQTVFEIRAGRPRIDRMGDGGWGAMHRAILAGLVSNIARRNDDREYETPTGVAFSIHPSSGLKHTDVPWVMVSEIVETSRRYGRMAAKVRGDWVERVAPHLVRREYEEPHYLIDSGQVAAFERVYYAGLVLVPRRRVPFGPLDPVVARDIFIQEALVEEKLRTRALFMMRNIALRKRVEALEEKERRRDLLASNEQRFRFYESLIPHNVHSGPSFDRWRLQVEAQDPDRLVMAEADMFGADRGGLDSTDFPDHLETSGSRWRLDYRHEPGELGDGVAINVALAALEGLSADRLEWGVPGMLSERIEAMIRSLAKRLRTRFSPVRETTAALVETLTFGEGVLSDVLARHLTSIGGVVVESSDFDRERLPAHLRMLMIVRDDEGREVERGSSLDDLRMKLASRIRGAFRHRVDGPVSLLMSSDSKDLPESPLPEYIVIEGAAGGVRAWLALSRKDGNVHATGHARHDEASTVHRGFLLEELKVLSGRALSGHLDWLLENRRSWPEFHLLAADCSLRAAVEELTLDAAYFVGSERRPARSHWTLRDRSSVQSCFESGFSDLSRCAENVVERLEESMRLHASLALALQEGSPQAWRNEVKGMEAELALFLPRSVADRSWFKLERTPRHLRALDFRLKRLHDKGPTAERRDQDVLAQWLHRLEQARPLLAGSTALAAFEFALEEYRAHLAVPSLALPGSGARRVLVARWNELCAGSAGRLVPTE